MDKRDVNERRQAGDLDDDTDFAAGKSRVGADGKPSALAGLWRTLEEAKVNIADEPPRRKWLLKIIDDGALPLGKAGVLAAGGGTGKTMALVQLALAVATGGFWLGTFKVATPGNVLIALAEEDMEEVHRRFHKAANVEGLDRDARAEATRRIVALPLAGNPVALTCKDKEGNTTESPFLAELRQCLADREWSLIILDPLARWAGDDAEVDNAAATRFVQAVESLVRSPGNPTVLVAHHSSAASIKEGQSNVRGASGIVDGFRWAAVLDAVEGENEHGKVKGVRLSLQKTNYTMPFGDVYLMRSAEGGAFVPASDAQREALEAGRKKADDKEARKKRLELQERRAVIAQQEADRKAKEAETRARMVDVKDKAARTMADKEARLARQEADRLRKEANAAKRNREKAEHEVPADANTPNDEGYFR